MEFLSQILANKLTECQIHTLFLIFHQHWTLLIRSKLRNEKRNSFLFSFFEIRIKAKKQGQQCSNFLLRVVRKSRGTVPLCKKVYAKTRGTVELYYCFVFTDQLLGNFLKRKSKTCCILLWTLSSMSQSNEHKFKTLNFDKYCLGVQTLQMLSSVYSRL